MGTARSFPPAPCRERTGDHGGRSRIVPPTSWKMLSASWHSSSSSRVSGAASGAVSIPNAGSCSDTRTRGYPGTRDSPRPWGGWSNSAERGVDAGWGLWGCEGAGGQDGDRAGLRLCWQHRRCRHLREAESRTQPQRCHLGKYVAKTGGEEEEGNKVTGDGAGVPAAKRPGVPPQCFQIRPASGVQEGSAGLSPITSAGSPRLLETTGTHGEGRRPWLAPHSTGAIPELAPVGPRGTPGAEARADPSGAVRGAARQSCRGDPEPKPLSHDQGAEDSPKAGCPPGQAPRRRATAPTLPGSGPARTWPWGSR